MVSTSIPDNHNINIDAIISFYEPFTPPVPTTQSSQRRAFVRGRGRWMEYLGINPICSVLHQMFLWHDLALLLSDDL